TTTWRSRRTRSSRVHPPEERPMTVRNWTVVSAGWAAAVIAGCQPPAAPAAPSAKADDAGAAVPALKKTDHVMFGGTPARNLVNPDEKNIPDKPDINDPAVLLWKAELGALAYGGPTVGYGRVFCGTNNERPRNKRDTVKNADGEDEPIDRGVVMC